MSRRSVSFGAAVAAVLLLGWRAIPSPTVEADADPQACAEEPEPLRSAAWLESVAGDPLFAHFPEQAAAITGSAMPFAAMLGPDGIEGYAAPLTGDGLDPMPVILPARGSDAIHFATGPSGDIAVYHQGMSGAGRKVGGATAYSLDGGTSYWATDDGKVEEWLRLDHLADGVVATYAVKGATFAQHGEGAEVMGDDGVAWLEVAAPEAWSADGQAVEVWLEARGSELDLVIALPEGAQAPLLIDPVWTTADDLNNGRYLHTSTTLLDGRILVAGGIDEAGQPTQTTEIFDPLTNTWTAAAPMPQPLRSHAATLLDDGRVLVTRGKNNWNDAKLAYLYTPATNSWAVADPTRAFIGGPGARIASRAVKLPNGKVLLAGYWCCPGNAVQIYDPATDTFRWGPGMTSPRLDQSMMLLPDGSILTAGGGSIGNGTLASTVTSELLIPDFSSPDPYINGTWVPLPDMNAGHTNTTAVTLSIGPDAGKVLVCGGLDGVAVPGDWVFTRACDLYDPASQTWSVHTPMPTYRQRSGTDNGGEFLAEISGSAADDGKLAFVGGWPYPYRTDVYDPESDSWSYVCGLDPRRLRHVALPLDDGSVVAIGGQVNPTTQGLRATQRLYFSDDDNDCDGIPNAFDSCPGGGCWTVGGRVFADANEDCDDTGDDGMANALIRLENAGHTRYAMSDSDGYWTSEINQGPWTVTLVDSRSIEGTPACGGDAQSYTVQGNSGGMALNFSTKAACISEVSIDSHNAADNLGCGLIPYRTPCPTNQWQYCFHAYNGGNVWNNGNGGTVMTVTLPDGMTYQPGDYDDVNSCGVTETSVTCDGNGFNCVVSYDLGTVSNAADCEICTTVDVVSIPPGGWVASMDLQAQCLGGTIFDSVAHAETNECGCDPNDKAVYPAGCDQQGTLTQAEPLDYTVRFQNTGLGPAHNVRVVDQIDPDLDIESLRWRGTSHSITGLEIDENGKMIVSFEGIELPAAIQDLEGSQGYMQFQLEPLNTGKGTEYSNYADIYFDYNEVVVTNEVVNTIGMCLDAPGLSPDGPSRSGLGDGSNPGQGSGTSNSPNGGSDNPNQSGH